MSSFASVVSQSRVSVLSKLISANGMDSRLWLRGEIVRLVDPMLDALFLRLIMSPASASEHHHSSISNKNILTELCQLIEGEKKETNRLLRGQMDRLVNSLFFRLTNKLLVNMDLAGSVNAGESSQVVNSSDHVESSNTESHQIVLKQSSYDPHFYQSHQIKEKFKPKILTIIKRELEDGEHEMRLEKIQDNTTQTNQFVTSTDHHHLFHQIDSSLEDGLFSNQPISADHQQNGQVNNVTDNDIQDWDEPEIKEDGDDGQMIQFEDEEEEETVDGTDHEGEVEDDETEIASDNDEEDEDNQNEESSRLIASPPLDTTSPANQSPIRRQLARIGKQKQTEKQQPNEMANRNSKEDEEEEGEEVTFQSAKRLRSSRSTISSSIEQNKIIPQTSDNIATECTTNPIQPNRHLKCSHCLKSFDRKSDFRRHLLVHTGERPFQCNLCDERFSQVGTLTRHQLIHQNMKHFQCDYCDKQFNHKVTLNNHLLIHSGERPYQCGFCGKTFTHLSTRNSHEQAIHLHVKPYRCKQCSHTATKRVNVIAHIRVVHFGLPATIKEQRALNIVDHRDPKVLVEKV